MERAAISVPATDLRYLFYVSFLNFVFCLEKRGVLLGGEGTISRKKLAFGTKERNCIGLAHLKGLAIH
jgi:hypothetical protein